MIERIKVASRGEEPGGGEESRQETSRTTTTDHVFERIAESGDLRCIICIEETTSCSIYCSNDFSCCTCTKSTMRMQELVKYSAKKVMFVQLIFTPLRFSLHDHLPKHGRFRHLQKEAGIKADQVIGIRSEIAVVERFTLVFAKT